MKPLQAPAMPPMTIDSITEQQIGTHRGVAKRGRGYFLPRRDPLPRARADGLFEC
jgi:hypothetical protein